MKKSIVFFLNLIMASACSDKVPENSLEIDKEYRSTRIEHSDIRMFTKSGEITNQESKNQVMSRFNTLNDLNFEFLQNDQTFTIENADFLLLTDIHAVLYTGTSREFRYQFSSGILNLVAYDTTFKYYPPAASFIENVGTFAPYYNKKKVLVTETGTTVRIEKLDEKFAYIEPNRLKFPVIKVFHFASDGAAPEHPEGKGTDIYTDEIYNDFQIEVYKYLGDKDTLLIQRNWVIFE